MSRIISLSYATVGGLGAPEFVSTAAAVGFRFVGMRLATSLPGEVAPSLMGDAPALRTTKARLETEGVSVLDIEALKLEQGMNFDFVERLFNTAQSLGARHVLTVSDESDDALTLELFQRACERAAAYGLTVDLEFLPYGKIRSLDHALRIVGSAQAKNGRVVVDILHFDRSAGSCTDLSSIPIDSLSYAHLCDAPKERPLQHKDMMYEARHARSAPGEGGLDVSGFVEALPPELPLAVEIMNDQWRLELTPTQRAERAFKATANALRHEVAYR